MAAVTSVRADDWLLTPENAVITFIDYRPDQYAGVGSIGVDELLVKVITPGLNGSEINPRPRSR